MNLEGEIGEIQLVERLVELWREQFTGAIRFENDGIIKIIYFKGGDVLSASTNDRSDSIDEILMRAGKVSREHVKQALAKRKENETLGDALLNLGFITRKELTWARRVQVIGVIRSIMGWTAGSFTIVSDYLPKREEGTLFPLPQILVELIVTEQDRQKFERAMDGGSAVFTKTADFTDVFRRLGLNEDAEAIASQIDGTNTANEVALASGKDTFNVYKLLHALTVLGIVQRSVAAAEPQVVPQVSTSSFDDFSFESAGVADAADIWNEAPAAPPVTVAPETAYSAPSFELDDTPAPSFDVMAEPEPEPVVAPDAATTAKMPAWDTPPREPAAVPIPAPIEPPAEAEEEQWGFDEAQIETSRRATEPVVAPATPPPTAKINRAAILGPRPKKKSRFGLILALMVVFVLAGVGYAGFWWWQQQQEAPAPVVVARPKRKAPRPPAETGTVVPALTETLSSDTTGTTATTTAATVTEPPMVVAATPITPEPAPKPAPAKAPVATNAESALPVVQPKTPSGEDALRTRYDAMAQDFAANKSGNFTVQFAIYCKPASVTNALRAGGSNVWFVKHGSTCYRAYYGHFQTRDEAQRALASLPNALRDPAAKVSAMPR